MASTLTGMRSFRPAVPILILVGLALFASACGGSSVTGVAVEDRAAPASSDVLDVTEDEVLSVTGEQVSVAVAGEDTLLWFWAPW